MNTQVKIDVIGLQKEVKKLAGRDRNIHAIKVYKSGNTLLDNTYNGYDKNEIHNVFSCTKSVLSILIGIAIDKAFIKTVDEKVVDLLFDYKKYFEGDKENMTLKDLLTMRSGIEWDEFAGFGRKDGIWLNFLRSED
ncbi:MAG: serine hydrolase, partial [Acidaminobacteraceae bacterium]